MNDNSCLHKLALRHIRPTAIRLLILRTMMKKNRAVSQPELEQALITVDKSTIFRTITVFLNHALIHAVDDGSGTLKYAVCSDDCTCNVADQHVHFYCRLCRRTFCLRQQSVPLTQVPDGFTIEGVNYVLKGLCPHCAAKERARNPARY